MIRFLRTACIAVGVATALMASPVRPKQGLLRKLAGLLGLPSAPTQLRSEDPNVSGDIWMIPLSGGTKMRVTAEGNYRSPVFAPDGKSLFALRGDTLVRIALAGHAVREVARAPGVSRLAGIVPDRPNDLVMLVVDAGRLHIETLDLISRRRSVMSHDPKDPRDALVLAYLASDAREYGNVRLTVAEQHTSFRVWKDVFVQMGEQPLVNLTNGQGTSSRQPALSPDKTLVAYVNTGRAAAP
jgi:hypothetical protein